MDEYSMSFGEVNVGMPSIGFLPVRQYTFKVSTDSYKLTLPNKGTFKELDPEFFKDIQDESFEIFQDNVLQLSMLTKVLFAAKQYPELQASQVFCPISIELAGDVVNVFGQVVEFVKEVKTDEGIKAEEV